jgi:transcriptional regulator with XRE-family HTH domain
MMRYLRLRQRRLQRKLSVYEFAAQIGVSPLTVRLWERGLATPAPARRARIQQVLGWRWETLAKEAV